MRQPVQRSYDDRAAEDYELVGEERARRTAARATAGCRRSLLTLAVMAVFAGGLWFAYVQGTRHATRPVERDDRRRRVPLIRADEPPDQGQARPAGRHGGPGPEHLAVQRKPGGAPVEKLLPPPEQPMPRPAPPPAAGRSRRTGVDAAPPATQCPRRRRRRDRAPARQAAPSRTAPPADAAAAAAARDPAAATAAGTVAGPARLGAQPRGGARGVDTG